MIYELNHFGIAARDLEKSLAFYQNDLGAKIVYRGVIRRDGTDEVAMDIVYLLIAGGLIELLHDRGPAPGSAGGVLHIAFLTDDLDGDYARLLGLGYAGLVAPKAAGTGAGRIAFFADPNGARVELIERDLQMREAAAGGGRAHVRAFARYAVRAGDMHAALRLYRDAAGMRVEEETAAGVRLRLGDQSLELLRDGAGAGRAVFDHFALTVGEGGESGVVFDPDGVKILLEKAR